MTIIFPELEDLLIELVSLKKYKKTSFNSFILKHIEKTQKKIVIRKIVNLLNSAKKEDCFHNPDLFIFYSKL